MRPSLRLWLQFIALLQLRAKRLLLDRPNRPPRDYLLLERPPLENPPFANRPLPKSRLPSANCPLLASRPLRLLLIARPRLILEENVVSRLVLNPSSNSLNFCIRFKQLYA